jgi:hypothetical protein
MAMQLSTAIRLNLNACMILWQYYVAWLKSLKVQDGWSPTRGQGGYCIAELKSANLEGAENPLLGDEPA